MVFENSKCKFSVPDRPTVRQQLEYFSSTAGIEKSQIMLRYWFGARELITEWECADFPDLKTDVDKISNPSQTEVIIWASTQVKKFMDGLEDIPKN